MHWPGALGRHAAGGAGLGHVAIDGKTLRGSKRCEEKAVHVLSAFATDLSAVIGDLVVAPDANEITAALDLLKTLPLQGSVVAGDAIFAQRRICEHIHGSGGDSLVTVKANQPALLRDIRIAMGDDSPLSPATT